MSASGRTALALALAALVVFAVTGGGRIVGSDEVTMLQVARAMSHGRIAIPEGATLEGRDGRHYSKNAAGQAVLALPLVIGAEALARLGRLDPARQELAVRFAVSFWNALVTALLLGWFYWGARRLGASAGAALAAALMLGLTTPLWVYAKSFMAEPLQALGLLLALLGASLAAEPDRGRAHRAERIAAAGAFLAISVKLSMLPVALACLAPLLKGPPRRLTIPLACVLLALLGHGAYNWARFGTPLESGYGAQATPAAYTTPLLVGLYGLLLSSGKGVMWFAPALWLAPRGWQAMRRGSRSAGSLAARLGLNDPRGRAALGGALAWVAGLLLYSRFQHWAGDGSFGPRYLVPFLPLAFLPVAFSLSPRLPGEGGIPISGGVGASPLAPETGSRSPRPEARVAAPRSLRLVVAALAVIGLAVQIGGVAIYFGAEMREVGDFPYTRSLADPRFMSESHWNPAFSPIAGHWRMLDRNTREHLAGDLPRLLGRGERDARLGLGAADQQALLHALDFWWLYLIYAGFPRAPVLAVLGLLVLVAIVAVFRLAAAVRAEREVGAAPAASRGIGSRSGPAPVAGGG